MTRKRARDYEADIDSLIRKMGNMASVMAAAAEEIRSRWPAHCDVNGFGPTHLTKMLDHPEEL